MAVGAAVVTLGAMLIEDAHIVHLSEFRSSQDVGESSFAYVNGWGYPFGCILDNPDAGAAGDIDDADHLKSTGFILNWFVWFCSLVVIRTLVRIPEIAVEDRKRILTATSCEVHPEPKDHDADRIRIE